MDTYEKKYKEALERAKEQLETAKVFDYKEGQIAHDIRETVYAIFPLLKESDDESIRKAILNYFIKCWGNSKDDICGVHVEDAIAWLEKLETYIKGE